MSRDSNEKPGINDEAIVLTEDAVQHHTDTSGTDTTCNAC